MKKLKRGSKKLISKTNKKGQMFLIAALIIVLLLYSLTVNYNYVRKLVELKDYEELRDNYNKEVPKIANEAIYITTDPSKCKGANPDPHCPLPAIQNFSKQYQQYANQKDPNFGLVSIIKDPVTGDIIIQNLLAGEQYIKINPKDYKGGITLMSENTRSTGTITLNGIGSIPVSVPVSSFGEGFTNKDIGSVDSFTICTDPNDFSTCTELGNLTGSTTITKSGIAGGTVDVDICPGGPRC